MNFDKELLKGSTSLIILKTLESEAKYGYQIIKDLEITSNNIFKFKEGTIYPILHLLEQKNYIKSFWEETESKRKRKYYEITSKGIKKLSDKKEEWKRFSLGINTILDEQIG